MKKSEVKYFLLPHKDRNFLHKIEDGIIYLWLKDHGRFEMLTRIGKEINGEEAALEILA